MLQQWNQKTIKKHKRWMNLKQEPLERIIVSRMQNMMEIHKKLY